MHRIVVDGPERLRNGCVERAEAEILAPYAEQLKEAGFFERRRLLRRLRQEHRNEIEARANALMPPVSRQALY